MIADFILNFLPELAVLAGALALFVISLGDCRNREAWLASLGTAVAIIVAAALTLDRQAMLFNDAYRVDAFSQLLKMIFGAGYLFALLAGGPHHDIREKIRPEYFLLLACSVAGLVVLVSCVELITLVIALELSSFPLFLMIPMRRERHGQRAQMEAAVKYIMYGIAATGLMFFGLSYLFGLTGTLHLQDMLPRLQPHFGQPIAIAGMALALCGLFYKMAVVPFHFWSPDAYEGASNETAGFIATLPKIGAIAVLVRLVSMITPGHETLAMLLAVLAAASMFYGNLIALAQKDIKRMLGLSAIAHAGYALVGFVTLDAAGFAAALYYIIAYLIMVLACFTVIVRVSQDGANVAIEDLAGLHKRAPLLAATLAVGIFGLAGLPPFAGFMGKLAILKSALDKGHLALVIVVVVNTAIAIYYYLQVVREAYFRDPEDRPAVAIDLPTRALCVVLIAATVALGVAPGRLLDRLSASLTPQAVTAIAQQK